MKKILLVVMAVAAIGFTSCGNKAQQAEAAADSTEVAINVDEEANATIAALGEQLQAGDANKLQEVLETVKTKVAELIKANPEVAKEYVAKVQNFLKGNADKVKSVIGDNAAAAAAFAAITEADAENVVSGLLQSVDNAATEAKDAAVDAVNEKVDEAKAAAEQKAEETKEAAKEKAGEAIDNAAASAKSKLGL